MGNAALARLPRNPQVEFLSDGGEDVRNLQLYLHSEAEHLLDWFSYHDALDRDESDGQGTGGDGRE